ncbi:DUF7662 domain-containing protein [Blastococcus saxobsidens]|uniref:DUF7662 domain-containing protein n=1 Tax=Blastococcus saxobsidens TaxID=138336 RepID=A0A4Q7Y8K8_9ACTN|nr:hypothetical protein [Blastococcus saxobsidens]RZU32471.1 hypothetical protein BKA19_2166 [Blastococcus saxobsidens]
MSKYDPLEQWLRDPRRGDEATLGFADVEELLGASLPASAGRHRAWWANDPTHVHARAWLHAGWVVDAVDQRSLRVRFRRAA